MTSSLLITFQEKAADEIDPVARTKALNLRQVASISEAHDGGCSVTYVSGQHDNFAVSFEKVQRDLRRTENFVMGNESNAQQRVLINVGYATTINLESDKDKTRLSASFHRDSYFMHNTSVSADLSEAEHRRFESLTIAMPA